MTKKEAAKQLRSLLSKAIRSLPDDVEYKLTSLHEDFTTKCEREHEEQGAYGDLGGLHVIELIVEEQPEVGLTCLRP